MESLKLNIEKEFKDAAERWGVKNDSRKYFSNKYYQIMQAIEEMQRIDSLLGETNSYIICAVLEQIDSDIKEMEQIFKVYTEMEQNLKELEELYKKRMEE